MAITNEFRESVDSGKKLRVRIMLKDAMLVDPTMDLFDEMINYASVKITDLYDEHNGEVLKYDNSDWNEEYLNNQMVVVVNNFSKERVELLRNMIKFIYRDRVEKIRAEAEKNINITRKQVGAGVTVAGAVATVAGICTNSGLLIAGGVAAAVVGVGIIVTDKGL